MSSAFDVNYSLRPSKNILRKMLAEGFRKLSKFAQISSYRYVGFGSEFFTDFTLYHKQLGIRKMISVEKNTNDLDRYKFNAPYNCVEVIPGHSNDVLSGEIDWDPRTILWLDYTSSINAEVLTDIHHFCSNARPSSVIIITVNVEPDRNTEIAISAMHRYRIENLIDAVGEEKVPAGTSGKDLRRWGKAKISREIIVNEIHEILTDRNGGLRNDEKISYEQLFNFHYRDGARMLTTGGIIYENSQKLILNGCSFESLDYIRGGEDYYLIDPPNLTYREIRYLDEQLPADSVDTIDRKHLGKSVCEKYSKIYRYFPTFTESEI